MHEPGKGQQAFAPRRRDMAAHRAEIEARRMDDLDRERRGRDPGPGPDFAPEPSTDVLPPATSSPAAEGAPPPSIARLRISQPRQAIPGLRVAMPRPAPSTRATPAEAPEAKPKESQVSSTEVEPASADSAIEHSDEEEAMDMVDEPSVDVSDPPLLPSHMCSSYFVEPLSWMSPILESGVLAGKLVCPGSRCGAKLGSFDWAGARE